MPPPDRSMLRKTLRVLAWVVGGLAGLCIALYLAIVVINWRDTEPSKAALRMAEFHLNRPSVRDQDNAYVYVAGFEVAPGESPLEMGRKRIDWLRRSDGKVPLDLSADPLGVPPEHRAVRHPLIRAYYEACGPRGPDCRAASEAAILKSEEWMASEAWLFGRYQTLLTLEAWGEYISTDLVAPLPPYGLVMDGQKLLLLVARTHAEKGNATGVREMLEADVRFWRLALESSDHLVSKMIATAALLRHFKSGAHTLRALPPDQAREATPAGWHVALTDRERSLRRCLNGEWILWSGLIRGLDRDRTGLLTAENSIFGRALEAVSMPLFQQQDTINLFADYYSRSVELLDGAELHELEAASNRVTELSRQATLEAFPPRTLFNIPGRMLLGFGPDYGAYARRVGDIEGVRRAALAAVSLHESQIAPDEISAALAAFPLRNPYNDEPFTWDAVDGAVVFRGLEPGERGEHRIP